MDLKTYLNREKIGISREIIISVVISSLVTGLVSFYCDQKIDTRTSKRQFLYEFSRTFFDNPNYRKVSIAIENQYLYGKGKILSSNGGKFSDYEIDNYLYFLYDLYSLVDEGLVSTTAVAEQYGYYICITYNNPEIQKYRLKLLKEGFSDTQALGYLNTFSDLLGIEKGTNCKTL